MVLPGLGGAGEHDAGWRAAGRWDLERTPNGSKRRGSHPTGGQTWAANEAVSPYQLAPELFTPQRQSRELDGGHELFAESLPLDGGDRRGGGWAADGAGMLVGMGAARAK
jgi:hypothetical protein